MLTPDEKEEIWRQVTKPKREKDITITWDKEAIEEFMRTDRGVATALGEFAKDAVEAISAAIHEPFFKDKVSWYYSRDRKGRPVARVRLGGGHPGKITAAFFEAKYRYMQKILKGGS